MSSSNPTVFISYSHQDESWKEQVVKQLRVLKEHLEVWDDRRIEAGDDWRPEIEMAMASARIAVLLVSADFLISRFISESEVPELLRRREDDDLRVIPIIVRPCAWQAVTWLSKIQSRPKDGRALSLFTKAKAELHLADLALEIYGLLSAPPRVTTRGRSYGLEVDQLPPYRGSLSVPEWPTRGATVGPPPLHNLPYPSLESFFTGRQADLDALAGPGTTVITQSPDLSGLGGVGKTRLAVEYAWRSAHRHTATWFIRADSPESLRRGLAALAWRRENPGWLMILDNVDTPEAAVAILEVLPSLSEGRVLITSRLTSWPASIRKRSLDTLPHEEAIRFLLHRTQEGRARAEDDERQAAALAETLEGLPLALEQAAAFIIRRRMSLADYLHAWEQERTEVLKWYDPQVMEYPASVAATWQQTFHYLSPTAADLLRRMAFLAPDPFPASLLDQAPDDVEQAALDELADYSMITRLDGGFVVIHRMVQAVMKSR